MAGSLRRVALRAVAVIALALIGLIGVRPLVAAADPVVAPKNADGTVALDVTQADDGSVSGTLTLVNPNDRQVTVTLTGIGRILDCKFTLDKPMLPALSSTDVTVTSSKRCDIDKNGEAATLSTKGDSTTDVPVSVTLKDVAKPVSLGSPLVAFLDVAPATLLFFVFLIWWRRPRDDQQQRLGWSTDLTGVPSGWTFKDSWATNVGAISTLFVAIFGTNDVVKALVGDESTTLPGRLLIIAGIAGLILGLAPLAVKAIGPLSTTATVSGLMVGAWLTTTAIAGQVIAVYAAFAVDKPTGAAFRDFYKAFDHFNAAVIFAAVLVVFLLFYVYRTVQALLTPGADPPPKPTDEMLVASATLVAAQVCCESGARPEPKDTTLIATAYVRAVTFLEHTKKAEAKAARQAKDKARADREAKRSRLGKLAMRMLRPVGTFLDGPAAQAPKKAREEPGVPGGVGAIEEEAAAPTLEPSDAEMALDEILRRSGSSATRSAVL